MLCVESKVITSRDYPLPITKERPLTLSIFQPIHLREAAPEKKNKLQELYVWSNSNVSVQKVVELATILESGRIVARDIGGGDPERMAAPRIEEYIRHVFEVNFSGIEVDVISDPAVFAAEYPLFAAVNRAAGGNFPTHLLLCVR